MTLGQNSTLNCDPNTRWQFKVESWLGVTIQRWIETWGLTSTWNQDPGSQLNVELWAGVTFQRGILTRVTIQRGIMTRGHILTWNSDPGHNSTWNYDPGSKFHVELWPGSEFHIKLWSLSRGHNLTLNHDSGSKFNVELIPRVLIQRGIKTRGHNSTGVQILSVGGVVIQWPLSLGSQFNMKNPLNPEHSPLNQDPTGRNSMGSKFNPTPA